MEKTLAFPLDIEKASEVLGQRPAFVNERAMAEDAVLLSLANASMSNINQRGLTLATMMGAMLTALHLGYALGIDKAERTRLEDLFS
jgi:hypothetical protein